MLWPESYENRQRNELLSEAIESLGHPCNQIVRLFYLREYCIEAIQHTIGYNSSEVVRSQKKRCMQYLRKRVFELFKQDLR